MIKTTDGKWNLSQSSLNTEEVVCQVYVLKGDEPIDERLKTTNKMYKYFVEENGPKNTQLYELWSYRNPKWIVIKR
jgi:hypothetical protein